MVLSMTGFGKANMKNKDYTFGAEIKSFNNRFIEVIVKNNNLISQYDHEIITLIKKKCIRGKLILNIKISNNNDKKYVLNNNKLKSIIKLSNEIKKEVKIEDDLSLNDLIKIPYIYDEVISLDNLSNKKLLFKTINEAISDLNIFRKKEGKNLLKDLNAKLKKINSNLSNIKFLSKNTLKGEYKLLSEKISKITNSLSKIDKDRLYQEIAILNERKDINEEIIRMSSHITLFQSCIKSKTNCGKKMNFLLQEMLREANTIGSKSDNFKISHIVVDLKSNLEQLREQVQNII